MKNKSAKSSGGTVAVKRRYTKSLGQRMLDNWQLYALLAIPVLLTIVYTQMSSTRQKHFQVFWRPHKILCNRHQKTV